LYVSTSSQHPHTAIYPSQQEYAHEQEARTALFYEQKDSQPSRYTFIRTKSNILKAVINPDCDKPPRGKSKNSRMGNAFRSVRRGPKPPVAQEISRGEEVGYDDDGDGAGDFEKEYTDDEAVDVAFVETYVDTMQVVDEEGGVTSFSEGGQKGGKKHRLKFSFKKTPKT
jgi:hypothetical protein